MNKEEKPDRRPGPPYVDESLVINSRLSEIQQQQRVDKAEQRKHEASQRRTNWLMILFTALLFLTSAVSDVILIREANIASQTAETAARTLKEMQTGSGATDTHTLALQAVTQATQTGSLATAANEQAKAAKRANEIAQVASRSVQRAFIVVDHLDIFAKRSSSGEVAMWIVNPVVTNSGNTPTKNLYFRFGFGGEDMTHWPQDKEPPPDPINFPSLPEIRRHLGWQRGIVGPHANISNLTVLTGFTGNILHGPGLFAGTGEFVWGAFAYGDVFDDSPKHVTEFCFSMLRTSYVGDQFAPYGRCSHHNCVDEECASD